MSHCYFLMSWSMSTVIKDSGHSSIINPVVTMRSSSRTRHVQDQRWAWLVLAAGFANCVICVGVATASGVYVTELISYYNVHKMAGAVVGSVMWGSIFIIGPVCSIFINMTSHRTVIMTGSVIATCGLLVSAQVPYIEWLYATYGLITGAGLGFIFAPTLAIVPFYFRKYRGIAIGVTIAGVGAGIMVIPVLGRFLIDKYSWQPSMYVMAGICLQSCVFGAIMQPVHPDAISLSATSGGDTKPQDDTSNKQSTSWVAVITDIPFIFFFVNSFLSMLGTSTAMIMLPDLFTELHLPPWEVDTLLISVGAGSITGRLGVGAFSNLNRVSNLLLYAFLDIICGVFVLIYGLSTDFVWLMVASLGFGMFFGAFITLQMLCIIEILGLSALSNGLGVSFFSNGVGMLLGPIIAGAIFDVTHTYTWSFISSAVVNTIGGLLIIPGYLYLRRHRRKDGHITRLTIKAKSSNRDEQEMFILD